MRSTSLIATASALLLGFPLASATPASLHSRSPTPKAATPISIPLYRRAPRVKRDGAAGFLKKAQRLKQKYGGSTARSGRWSRRDGSVSMTSYEDSEYYGSISVGTPAVEYQMILDTGSSDMILATDSCNGCSSSTPGYSASSSSTAASSTTAFDVTYGSGSASGTLAQDVVSIAGYSVEQQTFGACTTMNAIVDGDISGLLGLGWSTIASSGAIPVVEALAVNGSLPSEVFGFSFKSYAYDELTSETMAGGTLTVGSVDTSAYSGDINWVNIQLPGGYWAIPLEGVTVEGTDVSVTADAVIIDTGTTLIGAPSADVSAIFAQISDAAAVTLDGDSGYYSIPCTSTVNVSFTFGGVSYNIPSESFNAGAMDTSGTACLASIFALETSSTISWIVGDAFLTGVYSAFRFSDPPAVGFAALGSGGSHLSESSSNQEASTSSSSSRSSNTSAAGFLSINLLAALALAFVVAVGQW